MDIFRLLNEYLRICIHNLRHFVFRVGENSHLWTWKLKLIDHDREIPLLSLMRVVIDSRVREALFRRLDGRCDRPRIPDDRP